MKCRLEVDMEGKPKLEGEPRRGSGEPERQEGIERNKRDKFDATDSLQG